MYRGNLVILFVSGIVVSILLAVFIGSYAGGMNSSLYIIVILSVYLIYVAYMTLKEFRIYILDKQNGIQEEVLKFYNFKVHFKSLRDNLPPTPIAVFRFCNSNKAIALIGDYREVRLVKGWKYNVRFYRYSGILVDIKYCDNG
jgi:hypothetical protein